MAQASGGLVTSFIDTVQGLQQQQRQKEQDRQNAIQTATENAFRQHGQELQMLSEKRQEDEARQRAAQFEATNQLNQQKFQETLAQHSRQNAVSEARVDIAKMTADQRKQMSVSSLQARIASMMLRNGYQASDPGFKDSLDAIVDEFYAPMNVTVGGQPISELAKGLGMLGPNPFMNAKTDNLIARTDALKQGTQDLHDVRTAQATHIEAETKSLETRDALSKQNMELKWKEFGLNKDKFNFDKIYKNRSMDVREFEANIHQANLALAKNRFDLSAQKERDGLIKFATEYRQRTFKDRTAAGLAFDKAKAAVDSATRRVSEINSLPKEQQADHAKELIELNGVIAGTGARIKDLGANFMAAQQQYKEANDALAAAQRSGAQVVTPRGGMAPADPFKLGKARPADTPPPNAKQLIRSATQKSTQPSNGPGSSANPIRIKSNADLKNVKRGQYIVTPDGRVMKKN